MAAADVISIARQQIGKPYIFGTAGPNTFDCSGLVVYAFKKGANKNLPHFTGSLILLGSSVSKSGLQPGDLVFPDPGHVQIYTGNGMVVEAPHTGAFVREVKMWGFWQARRLIAPDTNAAPPTAVTVGNPLVPDSIEQIGTVINKVTNPVLWRVVSYYTAGVVLLLIGLLMLVHSEVDPLKVVKAVAK